MIRFGLVGYGAIGKFRAQALQQTPGAELAMVAETFPAAREQAVQHGLRAVADLEELAAQPDIDAVIVSTPPNLHAEHCITLLRAGKHVLCEKPLAPNVTECQRIVDEAEASGKTFGTGFNYRFYLATIKARELIASGAIGKIDHVKSFAGHPGGPEFTHQWVHDPTIMGGGALMDNGIHVADLTLHFLGPVAESFGVATEHVWQFPGSEDNGYVLMQTADGKVGMLHASWTEWTGYQWRVEIYGADGCVRVQYPPMMTTLIQRPGSTAKKGTRKTFLFPQFQLKERLRSYRYTIVQSFILEQLDFMNRIAGKPGVGATGLDGLRAVELAQSAYTRHLAGTEALA